MNRFRKMSPADFAKYHPKDETEAELFELETRFPAWCVERGLEPDMDEARESFAEEEAEQGDSAWETMDENDRLGHEDNMNKD